MMTERATKRAGDYRSPRRVTSKPRQRRSNFRRAEVSALSEVDRQRLQQNNPIPAGPGFSLQAIRWTVQTM